MNNFKQQFERANLLHANIREIVAREFKSVVDKIPAERREERELIEGRFLAANEFLASVSALFVSYESLLTTEPNGPGIFRALNDLAFGFETNQFYTTFRGYLHPVLMCSIQSWLEHINYRIESEENPNSQTAKYMLFATKYAWLQIFAAAAFCFGGHGFASEVGKKLRDAVFKVI